MRKFIIKFTLLVVVFAVVNLALLLGVPQDKNAYLCEYNHKVFLLEHTPHPVVVFVGGSNVAFGNDSKTISDSLGRPVVNFGLHGGIGVRYPLEDCLRYLRRGDVVVLQFEYDNYFSGGNGEPTTLPSLMIATHWRNFSRLNARQRMNIVSGLARKEIGNLVSLINYPVKRSFDTPVDGKKFVNAASGFNDYGDEVSHFSFPSKTYHPTKERETREVDLDFIGWLDKTLSHYEQRGIRFVMMPPACIVSHYKASYNENITKALDRIHRPYITSPKDMALPDSCSFNTGYHLNREGCRQHSLNMIKWLKQALKLL